MPVVHKIIYYYNHNDNTYYWRRRKYSKNTNQLKQVSRLRRTTTLYICFVCTRRHQFSLRSQPIVCCTPDADHTITRIDASFLSAALAGLNISSVLNASAQLMPRAAHSGDDVQIVQPRLLASYDDGDAAYEHQPQSETFVRGIEHANLRLLPLDECGPILTDKILNGNRAQLMEYPWMAQLEYEFPGSGQRTFGCAGTLISEWFVLTAAHCLTGLPYNMTL